MLTRQLIIGLLIGFSVPILFIGIYFGYGFAPVATADAPLLFEPALARAALHSRIRREMPATVPIPADPANLGAGAKIYQEHCATCHGDPGATGPAISQGMSPAPPQLFVKMVTDDPVGETYWKTKNGIRMTGMPAFGKTLSETEIWQVSLLLRHADEIPDGVKGILIRSTQDCTAANGVVSSSNRRSSGQDAE
jgi:mono/diheme cytochrome c family protein